MVDIVIIAYLALLIRIFLMGLERIVIKTLGAGSESDSVAATFLFFIFGSIFLLPALLFVPNLPESYSFVPYLLMSAFVYSLAFILYVKSLSMGDASLVSPLYNFNLFFLLIFASIYLGDKLSILKILGMVLLVYGTSFLNRKENILNSLHSLIKNRACQYMIGASLLIGVGRIIDGTFVQREGVNSITYGFGIYVGVVLFLFVYVVLMRKLNITYALLKKKAALSMLSGFINSYSYLFFLVAITEIEVSVVEPATMLSLIVTVLLARHIFKEKGIKDRLVGVIIMIAGAWFLFL